VPKPPDLEVPVTVTLPRHLLAEELGEKIATYGINQEEVPRAMSEILEGRAARLFRTSRLQTVTWVEFRAEFRSFFLPPRYFERLEDEIRAHIWGVDETFKDYLVDTKRRRTLSGLLKYGTKISTVYKTPRV